MTTPSASVIPTAEPVTKKSEIKKLGEKRDITITVLNGTAVDQLENVAYDKLDKGKWPVTSEAPASADDVKETVVYYSSAENEDVARGILKVLGTGDVLLSEAFKGAKITVVLGADYATLHAN